MSRLLLILTGLFLFLTLARPASATFTPTFTYTGQLLVGGSPVSGTYDFQFGLYTSGGTQVGSTITVTSVSVADGVYYVQIPFPSSAFNGQTLYLQIAYALHPASTYTPQSPRHLVSTTGYAYYSGLSASTQSLQGNFVSSATPSAGQVLTWTTNGNKWVPQTPASSSSLTLPYTGSVSSSGTTFSVTNSGSGNGIYGESDASNGIGVSGVTSTGTNAYGVYGYSTSGVGVYGGNGGGDHGFLGGIATIGGNLIPTGATGMDNSSADAGGIGVYGSSVNGFGIRGNSNGGESACGVIGVSSTEGGTDNDGMGSGYGVLGASGSGSGVLGQSTSGYGVEGDGFSGVGVYGGSMNNAGIYGISTNSYGVYGISRNNDAGYFAGNVTVTGNLHVGGTLTKGGGSFKIDSPLHPATQFLSHSFVESPDMMNIYNGNVQTDAHGKATVTMPDYFQALNQDFRYQLTCIGGFAPVYIAREMQGNKFQIAGGKPGMKVSWMVTGIRHDAWANAHRIPTTENKTEAERGLYLDPAAQGKPLSLGIGYAQQQKMQAARP